MQKFSAEYEKQVAVAFEHFINDEPYDYSNIRKEIYSSWIRSRAHNVKYDEPIKIIKLPEKEIMPFLERNSDLIEAAKHHLKKIYDVIKPSGYYIFLSDAQGYLLSIITDKDLMARFEYDPSLIVGASRNEKFVGTNAIGTSLAQGKPIVLYGEEHYMSVQKKYTCSGSPIRGANGEIVGAISITGLKEDYQELTLAMVMSVAEAIEAELRDRKKKPKRNNNTIYTFDDMIGECKEIQDLKKMGSRVAKIDSPILIWGESGTGKEVLAQSIHNESNRSGGPFIAINCGAIPRELIESELFGYEEGAFTGASKGGRSGKLEAASGGTLFLDEVESMPLDVQIKLLRVLSTFRVSRIGSSEEIPIDIRIISATKKDLFVEAEEGRFREDLYYRINTITLRIPPLRERNGDIRLLADFYIQKLKAQLGVDPIIPESFYRLLDEYDWRGNVRELRNILEGVIATSNDNEDINISMLPDRLVRDRRQESTENKTRLKDIEIDLIKKEIQKNNGNLSATAKALGIARSTLYVKIKNNEELSEFLNR